MYLWSLALLGSVATAIPTFGFYNGQINQGPSTICLFDNGNKVQFNGDGNLVVYNGANQPLYATNKLAPGGNCGGQCKIAYQTDGNLVTYYGSSVLFSAGTGGNQGALFVCTQVPPYLFIVNQQGNKIWTA